MGCFDFLLGLTGKDREPTVYRTTRNGKTYYGETGKGLDVRYDCGDEERQNVSFTFTSLMGRKQRIAVEEALIADSRARGEETDNHDRGSQRRRHGRK